MRDLLAHKVRTVLVVLSIAVGIFAVAVMMGGRAVLIRALDQSFPLSNPPSITYGTTPFDEHFERTVAEQPSVADAQGRHSMQISYRVNGGPWKSITLNAFKDYEAVRVARLDLPVGTEWPRRGEMLLERGSIAYSGLKVGDTIELKTAEEPNPTVRVSGTVHDINAVVPMMSGRSVGYVNWDTLADLGETQMFNQLDVVAAGQPKTLDQVTEIGAALRDDVIEKNGVMVVRMNAHEPGVQNLADTFKAITMLLVVVGAMTLLLSAFLVVNTISALVTQQTRQIGVMKAVGARTGQLVGMFLVMVLAYGVLGLLVALPLGQLATNRFVDFGSSQMNYLVSDYRLPGPILAIELAVGLLVPLLAAVVPVVSGMRMPVARALYTTGGSNKQFGDSLTDRVLGGIRGLSRPVALALRNTFRRKGRLALTLITLTLAASVFMAVASVQSSIKHTVDLVGQHRSMDLWANFYPPQPFAEVSREALRVPGVTDVEGWMARTAVRLRPGGGESPSLVVQGLPPNTKYMHPEIQEGRWLKPGDTNAIVVDTGVTKSDPDITVGSVLTLKMREVERHFKVVGIARGDLLYPYAYTPHDYLDAQFGATGKVDTIMIATDKHDAATQSEVARALTDRMSERQIRVAETMTQRDLQQIISDSLNIIVVFLVIMAALLATVGGIGLSGTMSINVLESTREIGVMRAVGASNASIYQIFITEAVVVGLFSWLLGVVLSLPMSLLLTAALGKAMNFQLTFAYSPSGVALWLGFVVVIAVLASLLPAYRAARVSVAEAIAYE